MHTSPRPGGIAAIRKLVLHVNVGPEIEGGAQSLAAWLRGQQQGYHEIIDDRSYVQTAQADQQVWAASGMNTTGYHICLIGQADQTAQEWHDAYSNGELGLAALRCAYLCHQFGLAPVLLTDAQIADPNSRGVCDHWGVNRAVVLPAVARGDHSMGPGDHTDVGPNFPWVEFMGQVVRDYQPAPTPGAAPIAIAQDSPEGRTMIKIGGNNLAGVYHGRQVKGGAPVYGYSSAGRIFKQGLLAKQPGHDLFVRAIDRSHIV